MLQHLVRCALLALIASGVPRQTPVLPAIEDPQADFAPGVPRSSTPGVTPPQILRQVHPMYTPDAMRAGVQGIVILDAVIGVKGSVEQSRVRCSLHPSLDAEAQNTVSAWIFKPAFLNGAPTPFVAEVQMEFRLGREGGPPRLTAIPGLNLKVQRAGSREKQTAPCVAPK